MARLEEMDEVLRTHLEALECPQYESPAWVNPGPLKNQRVAIISTAGLMRRGDQPFELGEAGYRIIPGDSEASEIVMSHVSTNFDRTGFQQDINVAFPIDRLRDLAADGTIDSVADYHYSFMGATSPDDMKTTVDHLAAILKKDSVDSVLLVPV